MLKLGLTGSIATGKSSVLEAFAVAGVPVFSADAAVHELYAGAAAAQVEALFGGVVHEGVVDRAKLSRRLLAEPQKLAALEALIHPLVRARIARFFSAAEADGAALAVADIPLLFEGGFDYGLDRIVVTIVDPSIQRQRALVRPGMDVEKLDAILARQLPQAEKRQRADYIFDTGKPLEVTRAEVGALIETITAQEHK